MATPWKIGLTGGIGSGKSTVAAIWQTLGAEVIDADTLSRQTTASGGTAIAAIARAFGAEFIAPDGALDRERMRSLAFADPAAKQQLEAIIHPLVSAETQRLLDAATASCVVFDIPLLVESGRWRARLDQVLVVDCEETTQKARTVARSALTADAVDRIIASQASRAQRLACADAVIFNEGLTLVQLQAQVREMAQRFGL